MKQVMSYRMMYMAAVCLGMFLSSQMILFIHHQIWDVNVPWNVLQYCLDAFKGLGLEARILAVVADGFIAYTFSRFFVRLYKQNKYHKQWISYLKRTEVRLATNQMKQMFKLKRLVVVNDDKPFAIVYGLFVPRIAISSSLISKLTAGELIAVLSHELYHCRRKHPLKVFVLTLFAEGFKYLPIFKQFLHYYKCWNEIEADRFAVQFTGDIQSLGNALVKLIRWNEGNQGQFASVQFADCAVNYRIKQLLVPDEPVRIPLFSKLSFAISSIGLILLTIGMVGGCLA